MKRYITPIHDHGTVAVDDTILVQGAAAEAGSRILEGFVPLFSAEAVERLEKAGYTISGKAATGEFGLDLFGEFSHYAPEEGKLSGAAACLVAEGTVEAALCVDLNGTPRRAAALAGVNFIKPTYGTVSRYGVIPCACSGEQIGVTAQNAGTTAKFLSLIAGHDPKDGTSLPSTSYTYATDEPLAGKRVAIVKELLEAACPEMRERVYVYAEQLKALGICVEEISFPLAGAAQTAWQILMAAETCNNVSRYDGVKFGYRTPNYENIDELYVNSRTEGLNLLTKATILYGSDVLSKNRYLSCYDKALRIRRLVAEAMQTLFESYDALLSPACAKIEYSAYDISDAFETVFAESLFTAIPNLIGIPAMVTGGVQLMAADFAENILLSIASGTERMCDK